MTTDMSEKRFEGTISTFDPNRMTGTVLLTGALETRPFTFDEFRSRAYPKPSQKVTVSFKQDGTTVDQIWPTPVP